MCVLVQKGCQSGFRDKSNCPILDPSCNEITWIDVHRALKPVVDKNSIKRRLIGQSFFNKMHMHGNIEAIMN